MSFWLLLVLVALFGAVGGFIGSFVNGNPAAAFGNWPIVFINTLIGAVAAAVSWLLYSSASQAQIGGTSGIGMTASTLGGAILVGMVGSAFLTKAVGQNLFQKAAINAAFAHSSSDLAASMMTEGPSRALESAKSERQKGALLPPQDGVPPQ